MTSPPDPYARELTVDGITYDAHLSTYDDGIGHETAYIGKGGDLTFRIVYEVVENPSSLTMTYEHFGGPWMVYDDPLL